MEQIKGLDSKGNPIYEDDLQTAGTMQEEFEKGLKETFESLEEDIDNPQIDNPTHYQSFNTEINLDCITAMRAAFGDDEVAVFCKLNAFKYNWRAQSKGGNTDIGKAIWYLSKYLELNK
jgi:hypothetical protein